MPVLYYLLMKNVLMITPSKQPTEADLEKFSQQDIKVLSASNATDALELIKNTEIDLVVSDLELPDISGDELCSTIKGAAQSPYVMLACSGKRRDLKTCGRCGADAYVQTPIDMDILTKRVAAVLNFPGTRATRVLVKVKVNSSFQSEPFFSLSHNVSVTGMMMEAEQSLAKGDLITCSFYLPDSERLQITCKVVRVAPQEGNMHHYGVEFIDLDNESLLAIEDFIQQERQAGNFH